jgi:hypothetical protein
VSGEALSGTSLNGPRAARARSAAAAAPKEGTAGGAGETSAAARRAAKAIRDFQAVFLMEMMKPLTQELAGTSSEDATEAGLGLSTGADVYSYFWGEALAQHLAGALPGLPELTAIGGTGEKTGTAVAARRAGLSPMVGSGGDLSMAAISADSAETARVPLVGAPDPGIPFPGIDLLAAGVTMDGLSALAAARAAGTASADATAAVVSSSGASPRARGATMLSEDVHALAGKAGRLFSLPENLVRAVVSVESGGRADAVSGKGAVGLMQLMPGTAKEMGVKDPRNSWDNLVGGAKYLAQQLERFGRLDHALAAYNAGPGAVEKAGGLPPFPETRDYVRRVLAVKARLDRTPLVGS